MSTKILFTALVVVFISSCSSPQYLPATRQLDINEYGSYITIILKSNSELYGELIAIDSQNLVFLPEKGLKCVIVPLTNIDRFVLRYAKPKHYGYSIPLGLVLPVIHGFYSIFTLPLHLVVTIAVTVSGETAFKYNSRNMNYNKLVMFARFPQGIPPGIDIASITRNYY